MKFLSWMKSKIHGKDNTIKPEPQSPSHHPGKEETGGSSSTLLSIGTFGDISLKHDPELKEDDSKEVEELRGLLCDGESDLPIEKIMESLSMNKYNCNEWEEEEEIMAVHNEGNEIPSCSRRGSMYKKSISFLIKKAFLCGGGFGAPPILRRPFPDPELNGSRMEKILKAVIRKKKHPKYLESGKEEEERNSNNWVKSDSEYIFLDL